MTPRASRRWIWLLAVVVTGVASAVTPVGAQSAEPTAAVSLGDSYLAGEGGRWLGNSSNSWADRDGTDRAAQRPGWAWRYVEEDIYGDSYATGCHRSDVAPIVSAGLDVDAAVNLACSGASTVNLMSSGSGGRSYRGEAPQTDQLEAIAATHDVEVVVISVGGNDLGFTDVILDCVLGYLTSNRWSPNTCHRTQDADLNANLGPTLARVAKVLADVKAVLGANGDDDARVILTSYPSPVVEADNVRFAEASWRRVFRGGCPFWDADLAWANRTLIPRITEGLEKEAANAGVEFLDLSAALRGHEACARTAVQGTGGDGAEAEWIRFVTTGITQGDPEESLHPNAYGQRALGRCIALAVASSPSPDVCLNTPRQGPDRMYLEGTPLR
jgi:lysophospholipase L1-like esterase